MKKTLAIIALAIGFTGSASAQSLLLLGNGGFLTATTMVSIDTARKQAALERQQKDEIRKKREANRKKAKEQSLLAQSPEQTTRTQ